MSGISFYKSIHSSTFPPPAREILAMPELTLKIYIVIQKLPFKSHKHLSEEETIPLFESIRCQQTQKGKIKVIILNFNVIWMNCVFKPESNQRIYPGFF